jgi:NAD(P)-dependent dehydrogenase (short-subunit alcohol dehydrogenase family)
MVGAEIYATVGSEEKVEYLMTTFGIPRNHIFHSRDTSFVDDVFTQTNGKGVDLALNSLSGELLHATWSCVAEFGTMVEIGKRDLLGSGKLAMDVFLANRSYCCVDLDQICFKRRSVCKQLLSSIMEYFEAGHIKPIRPIKIFDASMIREAFRYMQQGQHMGKIVISIRDSPENLKVDTSLTTRLRQVDFDGSASYLLVGGLGGLGRSVSRWMVEHGARSLTFFSRSAGSTEQDQHLVAELQSIGCQVRLFQGSVAIPEDVQKAVAISPNLKGILQMSMVLRDQSWTKMTLDEWNGATEPKVQGTLNLHQASAGIDMDFFVIFSSISGIVGQPGQANYAGANTFLDAFAQYSASLGRRIASVDIGAIEDIGVISNNEGLRRAMKATGAYMIKETELLDAIWAAMSLCSTASESSEGNASNLIRQNGLPTITARNNFVLGLASTVPLNSSKSRALWKKDLRMAAYRNISTTEGASDSSSDALKGFLAEARHDAAILKSADTPAFLAHEMGKKLFSLVLRAEEEIQTSVALSDLGMDSLVAIEMRSWWRQTFGFEISVLELLGMGSLDALGAHATEKLLNALEGEE